jgi:hypothetical protein
MTAIDPSIVVPSELSFVPGQDDFDYAIMLLRFIIKRAFRHRTRLITSTRPSTKLCSHLPLSGLVRKSCSWRTKVSIPTVRRVERRADVTPSAPYVYSYRPRFTAFSRSVESVSSFNYLAFYGELIMTGSVYHSYRLKRSMYSKRTARFIQFSSFGKAMPTQHAS